jgi:hypothetical protein
MKAFLAAATLLLAPSYAWGCIADYDCGTNGRCVKSGGAIYGVCVRDVQPADPHREPVPLAGVVPLDKEHCTFDADCGAGRACLRTSATATGACVKQR